MKPIGQLENVNPQEIWDKEPKFSQWLAKEENLQKLGDLIGIDMFPLETESSVGSFSADILAEEDGTGKKIIIENQYGQTNHDHLGKIITYASGKCASYVIWIVETAREEHRRAIEWLNESTLPGVSFFLVELEVVKIGDSLPAPLFNVVEKPNGWMKQEAQSTKDVTKSGQACLDVWKKFVEFASKEAAFTSSFKLRKPLPQRWFDISIGLYGVNISQNIQPTQNNADTGLYITDNKPYFEKLKAHAEEIEKILGTEVVWREATKSTRIIINHKVDYNDDAQILACFAWFIEMAPKLKQISRLVKV